MSTPSPTHHPHVTIAEVPLRPASGWSRLWLFLACVL